ncbi:MAG: tRNA 2-thiouridine(34) synthase MnmA [Clostridium sp.]|nr:tRNA 2-thiouridine(34) synthase MnmA [Clostridium sp.]
MQKKKVLVGMSGGVDSSVAAAVLLEQGYEVVGATMQIWPDKEEKFETEEERCCSLSAVEDARKVANTLGIDYYVLNLKDIFEEKVISYFKNEYLKGRTPNPCVACNRYIKFKTMLNKALSMGFDYIATGHYATVAYDSISERYLLKRSATSKKDQTYALYNLSQSQLSRTLMPIGTFNKEQVREKALKIGMHIASKSDSQEICFVSDNDYGRFIKENSNQKIRPGKFIDTEGNVLGEHRGIVYYTVGQRKGLGIALGKPVYVIRVDAKNNTVILGSENDIFSNKLIAYDLNYISINGLKEPMRIKAKIRYSAPEADATLIPLEDGGVRVEFDVLQRAITPGQSVVFYQGDTVVGGGVIA